ncbi:hypothetical protein M2440_001934 [Methylorubrum extorquens]|nr:hypothetical protein [Methylorubrum extorquens]MDF9862937.1 hypothetical protein [Methylorubrum pseudosasae]
MADFVGEPARLGRASVYHEQNELVAAKLVEAGVRAQVHDARRLLFCAHRDWFSRLVRRARKPAKSPARIGTNYEQRLDLFAARTHCSWNVPD